MQLINNLKDSNLLKSQIFQRLNLLIYLNLECLNANELCLYLSIFQSDELKSIYIRNKKDASWKD